MFGRHAIMFRANLFIVVASVFGSVSSDVNEINRQFLGYVYPQPPPAVQFEEEPPVLPPLYLPPFFDEIPLEPTPVHPPSGYLPPPPPTPPTSGYLPPSNDIFPPLFSNDDSVVVTAPVPSSALLPPNFRLENMSCIQGSNFRATFKIDRNIPQFATVDEGEESCITTASDNRFRIDLDSFNGMIKCGVRRCRKGQNMGSDNMCLVVRIPAVRGVRLPEDGMVTLMCVPQETVVTQTRHVKLGRNKIQPISKGRSSNSFIAAGGTQRDLKIRMGIFRKRPGTNVFDQSVQADNIIQLGEELMLKANINEGDGWKSSQIGPVLITGLNSKKSALLLTQNGCVNPSMRSICPKQPHRATPLSTELIFRAFLFQESPQGDEMVISVRTQGCLHPQDCTIKEESCTEDINHLSRLKRDVVKNESIYPVTNWESRLKFKVEPSSEAAKANKQSSNIINNENTLSLFCIALVVVLFVIFILLFLTWHICQNLSKKY